MYGIVNKAIQEMVSEKYEGLMVAGGNTMKEFPGKLPVSYSVVMLIYMNLTPPEFKGEVLTDHSAMIHYFSQRTGLQNFASFAVLTRCITNPLKQNCCPAESIETYIIFLKKPGNS